MLDLRPSPIRVSLQAARKMPRWILLALLFAFIVPGVVGHDIWSTREGAALGKALCMSHGDLGAWLYPMASGQIITEHGPLSIWIGAVFIRLFGDFIEPASALRLTTMLWFAVSTASLWYGTWFLARRREAQPIELMFEEQASYRDFGRLVADTATLFFVSLFGLILKLQEPTFENAELAMACVAYFGCAMALTRPYLGATIAGAACGAVILCGSLIAGMTMLVGCILSCIFVQGRGTFEKKIILMILAAFVIFFLWPATAYISSPEVAGDFFSLWAQTQADTFGLLNPSEIGWFVKHFAWYLCPAWPLAIWALWVWRSQHSASHIILPAVFFVAWGLGFTVSDQVSAENLTLIFIAPLCTLAAFGLMATRRSMQAMLDYFALAVFSLATISLWAYWFAWAAGFPPKMARSVINLAPDANASDTGLLAIVVAIIFTSFWIFLTVKRLKSRPDELWSGPWLASAGMTVIWVLALTLAGPVLDNARSYRPIAKSIMTSLQADGFVVQADCLKADTVPQGIRAMIGYYSGIVLNVNEGLACRYELIREHASQVPEGTEVIKRPRTEELFILRRLSPILKE